MNNIEWKEGAVCYANGEQWFASDIALDTKIFDCNDFQLNDPKQGDYLPKSELDTEQKYNDAVEVFGLFGFEPLFTSYHDCSPANTLYFINEDCIFIGGCRSNVNPKRELTYSQLMTIGKLKRLMDRRASGEVKQAVKSTINAELDKPLTSDVFSTKKLPSLDLSEKPKRRNKSKQAYDILKSLDYEYDLVKQCWYRKEWV